MSLVSFKAKNHPQQIGLRGALDPVDDRGTPLQFFRDLESRFGKFELDTAAAAHNAKCKRFYTRAENGLIMPWDASRVWCNPPYSKVTGKDLGAWVYKVRTEWKLRNNLIVMLLPANRTEQSWWQATVEQFRDRGTDVRVEFLTGRLRFIKPGCKEVGPNERPPFGCCLLIWNPR